MKVPVNKTAWIRLSLLALALINQSLVMFGYSAIPLNDEDLEQFISLGFTVVTAILAGWKDNDITEKARIRKKNGENQ